MKFSAKKVSQIIRRAGNYRDASRQVYHTFPEMTEQQQIVVDELLDAAFSQTSSWS